MYKVTWNRMEIFVKADSWQQAADKVRRFYVVPSADNLHVEPMKWSANGILESIANLWHVAKGQC